MVPLWCSILGHCVLCAFALVFSSNIVVFSHSSPNCCLIMSLLFFVGVQCGRWQWWKMASMVVMIHDGGRWQWWCVCFLVFFIFLFVMFVMFIVFLSSCLTCSQACAQIPSHHFFCTPTFKLLVVAFFVIIFLHLVFNHCLINAFVLAISSWCHVICGHVLSFNFWSSCSSWSYSWAWLLVVMFFMVMFSCLSF